MVLQSGFQWTTVVSDDYSGLQRVAQNYKERHIITGNL